MNLPGDLGRQLVASPAYRWEVGTGFSEVRIRPEGGWRENVVYCFELPEGIGDLIRNRTESAFGFCFSTGPTVTGTSVEGRVTDRMTGTGVPSARVLFLALPADTTPYTAVSGGDGGFRLRALPPGEYWAYAFQDRNRNLRLDRRLEPHDSVAFTLEDPSGATTVELAITEPDSTPPVLMAASPVDRWTVRLQFDDALDPETDPGTVSVRDTVGGRSWPVEWARVGEPAAFPPPDTADAPADTVEAPADTVEAPADTDEAPADTAQAPAGAPADTAARPARIVTVRLGRPLAEGVYRVLAEEWTNLRALVGGGDTTFVYPTPEAAAGGRGASGNRSRPR